MHIGGEAKHKFLKKMLHIGDNVAHWVHPVYVKFLFSGIAAVVRVDIENALKDDEWLSTDFMLFLKEKYENEKSIQKKWCFSWNFKTTLSSFSYVQLFIH